MKPKLTHRLRAAASITGLILAGLLHAQALPPAATQEVVVLVDGRGVGTMVLDTALARQLSDVERRFATERQGLIEHGAALDSAEQRARIRRLDEQRRKDIAKALGPQRFAEWERMTQGDGSSNR